MYPILRAMFAGMKSRNRPMNMWDTDRFSMRIWPIDIDMFMELNNGRTLTLYDLGRFRLSQRIGLMSLLRQKKWGFTVAGSFVRYRHRVTMFQKVEIRTRVLGPDGRFVLMEQAMWRGETCCSNGLFRVAVVGPDGVVPPAEVMTAMGENPAHVKDAPQWARALVEAEGERPWPPPF